MSPTAHVINLDRRPERWEKTKQLWSPHFNLVRWPATDIPGAGAEGCKKSHLALAEKVLAEQDVMIVIEDDAVPTEHFNICYCHSAWHYKNEWDYVNLGPCIDPEFTGKKTVALELTESEDFLKGSFSYRTHFVMYNRASLPLLRASLDTKAEVDVFLGEKATKHWLPVHVLAVQAEGVSDIRKRSRESSVGYATSERMLQAAVPKACVACYLPSEFDANIMSSAMPLSVFSEHSLSHLTNFTMMRAAPPTTEPAASNAKFLTACILAHRQGYSHMIYTEGTAADFAQAWTDYKAARKMRAIGGLLSGLVIIVPLALMDEMFQFTAGGTADKACSMQSFRHEIAWRLFRDHAKAVTEHVIPIDIKPAAA